MLRLRSLARQTSQASSHGRGISSLARKTLAKTVPVTHTPKLPPKAPPPKSSSSALPIVLAGTTVIGLAATAHTESFRDQVEGSAPFLKPILNIFHTRPDISPVRKFPKTDSGSSKQSPSLSNADSIHPEDQLQQLQDKEKDIAVQSTSDLATLQNELKSIGKVEEETNENTTGKDLDAKDLDAKDLAESDDNSRSLAAISADAEEISFVVDEPLKEKIEALNVQPGSFEAEENVLEPGLPQYLSEQEPPIDEKERVEAKAAAAAAVAAAMTSGEEADAASGDSDSSDSSDSFEAGLVVEESNDGGKTEEEEQEGKEDNLLADEGAEETEGEKSETPGDNPEASLDEAVITQATTITDEEPESGATVDDSSKGSDQRDTVKNEGANIESFSEDDDEQNADAAASYEKVYEESEVQKRITEALHRQREQDAAVHREFLEKQRQLHKLEVEEEVSRLQEEFVQILERERARLREEKQSEIQQHLMIQEKHHDEQTRSKLAAQAKVIMHDNENSFQTRLGHERATRTAVMQQLVVRLNAVEEVISSYKESERRIHAAHSMFLAAHGFKGGKADEAPNLNELKKVAQAHEFLESVINAFPEEQLAQGVCSAKELKMRFQPLRASLLKVANVQEGDGVSQYLLARVASAVKMPVKGLVAGDSIEARLARVEHFLEIDDVDMATRELNQISGVHRRLAADWLQDARSHLEVMQALDVARAFVQLSSLSLL